MIWGTVGLLSVEFESDGGSGGFIPRKDLASIGELADQRGKSAGLDRPRGVRQTVCSIRGGEISAINTRS
jgi:hypothetical protein